MTDAAGRQGIDLGQAQDAANARLRDYISRAAGQHRRAIARSFAQARDAHESRARHQLALAHSAAKTGAHP